MWAVVVVNERNWVLFVVVGELVVRVEPPKHHQNAQQMMPIYCQYSMKDEDVVEQQMLMMKHFQVEQ